MCEKYFAANLAFLSFIFLFVQVALYLTNKEASTVLCSVVKHDTERETDSNIA